MLHVFTRTYQWCKTLNEKLHGIHTSWNHADLTPFPCMYFHKISKHTRCQSFTTQYEHLVYTRSNLQDCILFISWTKTDGVHHRQHQVHVHVHCWHWLLSFIIIYMMGKMLKFCIKVQMLKCAFKCQYVSVTNLLSSFTVFSDEQCASIVYIFGAMNVRKSK